MLYVAFVNRKVEDYFSFLEENYTIQYNYMIAGDKSINVMLSRGNLQTFT